MRIRKQYYSTVIFKTKNRAPLIGKEAGYNEFIDGILTGWILKPHWKKCLIKWRSNFFINLCKKSLKVTSYLCSFSYSFGIASAYGQDSNHNINHKEEIFTFKIHPQTFYLNKSLSIRRCLPISLTLQEVISSIEQEYKEETNLNIVFSKELQSKLKKTERDEIVKESRKKLKDDYQFLLNKAKLLKQENEK